MNYMDANEGSGLAEIEVRAVEMVRQAGQIALARFHRPLQVEFKQANRSDPVTEADREVEAFLRQSIAELFPCHGILGEEGTEVDLDGREYLWVLDPIDGTNNYFNGLPLFGCSAGLLRRGEPVVGAIFLPVAPRILDEGTGEPQGAASTIPDISQGAVLHARLGGGTCLDGRPVRASREPAPEASSLSGLPGHHFHQFLRLKEMRKNPGELRSLGSVCYETGMVACGVFRYAVFRAPRVWDMAAGALIVREAGGETLVWRGGRWTPLRRFDPMPDPKKEGGPSLRHWVATTMVAGGPISATVARGLRPRRRGRRWLGARLWNRWWKRLVDRLKGSPPEKPTP